jgi:predicted Rdx family selenoprotein
MNTRQEAGSLQKELEKSLGVKPRIKMGGQGQLDVIVDGAVVFSRQQAGRFPTAEEIVEAVGPR